MSDPLTPKSNVKPIDFEFRYRVSDEAKAKIKALEDRQRRAMATAHNFIFD